MCLQGLFNIYILIIKRKLFVYFFPNIMKINFENFTGFGMSVQKNPNYYYYYYYCTQNFCIIWSYQIIYNIKYLYICLKQFFWRSKLPFKWYTICEIILIWNVLIFFSKYQGASVEVLKMKRVGIFLSGCSSYP